MRVIDNIARRLKQIHLLFGAPPELRREHHRHHVDAALEIVTAVDGARLHHSTDISHGGIFVEPRVPADPGEDVSVSVGELLQGAPAVIVTHRGAGSALRFHSVAHGAALTAWLVKQAGGRLDSRG